MGTFEAQSGFAKGSPIRLGDTGSIPFTKRRPVVDIETLSAKAGNELITVLAEHHEQLKKAGKSFLRRQQPRPEINLPAVVENLKEAVLEQYRISGAACVPPVLDLEKSHLSEIAALQEKATEDFCRQVLRAADGDQALLEQIYELCPSLKPAQEPDKAALAEMQRKADKLMASAMAAEEQLVLALRELDNLVREEAQALTGTNQAGNGRIRRQSEHVRHELVRLLERGEVCEKIKIPVARW